MPSPDGMIGTSRVAWARAAAPAAAALLLGCTASVQRPAVEAITANDGARVEAFEAMLRVLDENPEYVDEMFLLARRHPATLHRFVENTARESHDPALAQIVAEHLVRHPASLRAIQVRTIDAAMDVPEARAALAEAIEERAAAGAEVMTDRPATVRAVNREVIAAIARKPAVRAAFLASLHEASPALASILVDNPKTLTALMEEVLRQGGLDVVNDVLDAALSGEADDDAPARPAARRRD